MAILEVNDLTIQYGNQKLIEKINFKVEKGEFFALIGESGSGKSITSSAIGQILPGVLKTTEGSIMVDGVNMLDLKKEELRKARGERVAYIFQDYQNAFTPFIKIGKQLHHMLNSHFKTSKSEQKIQIYEQLEKVGLDPDRVYNSYPFQLSGGQMQRCAISQTMLLKPTILVADEPTTALDSVSTATVLKLIEEIKNNGDSTIVFITHDLRTVKKFADKIAIMFKGKIVEMGDKDTVINDPKHVYTKNLFAAVPPLRDTPERLPVLEMADALV